MLKDVFGFAEHQEKATYGLGYKLIVTIADIKIDNIRWYVPNYTPSIPQQSILSEQILSKTPTKLRYIEQSVFMKEVINQNQWNFELSSQESMNVSIWINVGFQQRNRQDSQNLINDVFYRLQVTSAQWFIGTEKD